MAWEKEELSQPENTPGNKNNLLSRDFDKWLRLNKEQKSIVEKTETEAKSQLASLRDDIKDQLRFGDPLEALLKYPQRIFSPTDHNYRGKYGALASIETSSPEDKDKTATSGFFDSVLAPFQAVGRIVFDAGKFVLSPRKELQSTLAYLEDANPGIQNI